MLEITASIEQVNGKSREACIKYQRNRRKAMTASAITDTIIAQAATISVQDKNTIVSV